ncbi:GGDEF domain-containing protein [Micromonospora sp. STR1s_5]|nr:GGDEF domain-containing protein [Micromonospora sp. STR1s_5]
MSDEAPISGAPAPLLASTQGLAEVEPEILAVLLDGLAQTHAGLCLCDEQDRVRYVSPTFRRTFFPNAAPGADFVDAMADAIRSGDGIKLESMPLDLFVRRVKERRRSGPHRCDFTVDLSDGSWWWINDRKLANGWMLVVATEITGIKQEELRLREAHLCALRASETDFLTGLPNRRSGMTAAQEALERFHGSGLPLTVALVDVDRFKSVNDIYGHDAGDRALVHVAQVLSRELGPRHHVSRFGGEEFLIVMPEAPATEAAASLRSTLACLGPLAATADVPPIQCTFSAGLASALASDDLKGLIARADQALYQAKGGGRGRVEIKRPTLSAA